MREITNLVINKLFFLYSFFKSKFFGFLYQKRFNKIKTFCLFIGYPRSGHSLVASLLDAHPDITVGMEWGVLPYIKLGYKKRQIFYSLIRNSFLYTNKKNNIWTGYSYKVHNSWQGKYKTLQVIGDKQGGRTSIYLKEDPDLLLKLEKIINQKPKLIHVIRNPFDIITTTTFRKFEKSKIKKEPNDVDLLPFIKHFFERAEVVKYFKKQNNYDVFDLYHEDFIKDPEKHLENLILFLGLKVNTDYLRTCASIVYSLPHVSRLRLNWPPELIQYVEKKINDYPFLNHYKFHN